MATAARLLLAATAALVTCIPLIFLSPHIENNQKVPSPEVQSICMNTPTTPAWAWEDWPQFATPGAPDLLRHIDSIANFRRKRESAAVGDGVSSSFQPFEPRTDRNAPAAIGMPSVPRCVNFSTHLAGGAVAVVGCSPGWTCRQYDCFRRCSTSFDPVGAATRATAFGMCRPEAPFCIKFGYCVQLGRVDYQLQIEEIAARIHGVQGSALERLLESLNESPGRPRLTMTPRPETLEWTRHSPGRKGTFPVTLTMATTRCAETRDLEDVTNHWHNGTSPYLECLAATNPICYDYVPGEHYGICTPPYPNIHSALWRSFAIGNHGPNHSQTFQGGLCGAFAQSVRKMPTYDSSSGWEWECVPHRGTFYNSLRWDVGSSDAVVDPILWNHGYKSIDMACGSSTWHEHRASIPYTWDIFLSGHYHCGATYFEGLDTAKLTPHHIFSSCRGCLTRYCSKKGMCEDAIKAGVNGMVGPVCKLMPEGDADILADFESGGSTGWVVKRDGLDMHLGVGTTIVTDLKAYRTLRASWFDGDGKPKAVASSFSAQQYVQPWLGEGKWNRKMEIRAYFMITSTSPLRLYVWSDALVVLAFSTFSDSPPKNSTGPSWCMHDTHIFRTGSDQCDTDGLTPGDRTFSLDRWCQLTGHGPNVCSTIKTKYAERLRNAVLSSHREVAEDPVNAGITSAGARCFSLLRADITLGADLEPYLMEINQDPYIPHVYSMEPRPTLFLRELFEEYFSMVGVTPYRRPPIQPATFREMTSFCVEQKCSASEFLALQRMVAEQQQVVKLVPVFPKMGLVGGAVLTPPAEWRRMRALLPDAQQGFDTKLEKWFHRISTL